VGETTRYTTRDHGEHGEVTLAMDVMFINKNPFVMTISGKINFGTQELVKKMKNRTLMTSMEQVIQAYHSHGFKV